MKDRFGPYIQMGILAEQMAATYHKDANLDLAPHLSHYMDEVDINIAADQFDHVGFLTHIRDQIEAKIATAGETRRCDFLKAASSALNERIAHHTARIALG